MIRLDKLKKRETNPEVLAPHEQRYKDLQEMVAEAQNLVSTLENTQPPHNENDNDDEETPDSIGEDQDPVPDPYGGG